MFVMHFETYRNDAMQCGIYFGRELKTNRNMAVRERALTSLPGAPISPKDAEREHRLSF
jgi:hypothetical protein